jgi:hypothetical protein
MARQSSTRSPRTSPHTNRHPSKRVVDYESRWIGFGYRLRWARERAGAQDVTSTPRYVTRPPQIQPLKMQKAATD